jgi:hypothetical protein
VTLETATQYVASPGFAGSHFFHVERNDPSAADRWTDETDLASDPGVAGAGFVHVFPDHWQFGDGGALIGELNGDGRPDILAHPLIGLTDEATSVLQKFLFDSYSLGRNDRPGFLPPASDRYEVCQTTDVDCIIRRSTVSLDVGYSHVHDDVFLDANRRLGKRLVDLNGDGLDDLVFAYEQTGTDPLLPGLTQTVWREAYLNDGTTFVRNDSWLAMSGDPANFPLTERVDLAGIGSSVDQGVRFID